MDDIEQLGGGDGARGDAKVEVGILGDLRVRREDGSVVSSPVFRTAKTRHLLRLLALQVDHAVPVEVLVEVLWPDVPEPRGRASLRTAASMLRRTFAGDHLVRVGDALRLRDVDVDVTLFRGAADLALRCFEGSDLAAGMQHARAALAHYRGDLAGDEPYLEALQAPAAQLALQHHHLLAESASAALRLGHLWEAVELGERALAVDPASERACSSLMCALMRLGERAAASRAYERCQRGLAEVGLPRSSSLEALHHEVRTELTGARSAGVLQPVPDLLPDAVPRQLGAGDEGAVHVPEAAGVGARSSDRRVGGDRRTRRWDGTDVRAVVARPLEPERGAAEFTTG